jgi:hypothetical protein
MALSVNTCGDMIALGQQDASQCPARVACRAHCVPGRHDDLFLNKCPVLLSIVKEADGLSCGFSASNF